ncbi:F0F1 ATP synthase subunit B' [Coleofasciculus sp. FACHB-64]|uniref:F0F1 ATP synthase subunit B' n=1 Tax=Cyanophyceae TaxID=3028117 RepID=UPI001686DCB4|nr:MULTISPECIES: F0F1 ATP synthase subunit B' [unclassified Coleofasciculus]MBD1838682.1 F0F1 ATP synthase subunit B' [Coleofasciculus sp. FACHB-501]MBD1888209.1 F0F1 ATP synthase subunit B' [Coleofasciculus sp. FACHB-SPT9]MBD1899588.1 F0F1 ATP synthase subunit B' [Coleofasciculus sp. FACHB-125]MBD1941313.1 F0F1 ATP synthase subunit B' [Coleofasciculus sp. FACHB-712]MBD2046297.1 F0F1 ATP synthase subunit B' [Coleofasciculus sp. FACHB-64]
MFDFDATLPLMAVQFLLLAAVLNVVFYKPLTKVLDERDDYIRSNEMGARERLAKAEQLAKQYEQQLADTRRQSQALIANAQADAQKIGAQQVAEAQQEAVAKREQASIEIGQQKQEALQSLETQVDELSRQILEKILGQQLVNR